MLILLLILLSLNKTSPQTLLDATSFGFRTKSDIALDDVSGRDNPNKIQNSINALISFIKDEIIVLKKNGLKKNLNDDFDQSNNEHKNESLKKVSHSFEILSINAFHESIHNVTKMEEELRILLLQDKVDALKDNELILNEITPPTFISPFRNMSMKGDTAQQQQVMMEAIHEVKGTEVKVKEMIEKALHDLEIFKQQASKGAIKGVEEARRSVNVMANELFTAKDNEAKLLNEYSNLDNKEFHGSIAVFDDETWFNAGYVSHDAPTNTFLSADSAINLIKDMPLKMYGLKHDKKKDLIVNKTSQREELRTRSHFGIIDSKFATGLLDPLLGSDGKLQHNVLSFLHLNALKTIADEIDLLKIKVTVLGRFTSGDSKLQLSISNLYKKIISSDGFESMTKLASTAAAAEAELKISEMKSVLYQTTRHLNVEREKMRSNKMAAIIDMEAQTSFKESWIQTNLQSSVQVELIKRDTVLSSMIELLSLINEICIIGEKTEREIHLLHENEHESIKGDIQSIHVDAVEERKNEVISMHHIGVLGEETRKAVIQIIEVTFEHLVHGIVYLLTNEEGRHQLLIAILAASILVFTVFLSKELINVLFCSLIRLMSKPRLVREWGSANSRDTSLMSRVVLSEKQKVRMRSIRTMIDRQISKKAPLRNIIIYGEVGTGKSMLARAIAEAAQGMPYACLSGADIAPLEHLGAAELRNVLTWANSRPANGGIIIIDEAESALGSRIRKGNKSKMKNGCNQSFAAARDALNVFLSMTGESRGNMMMILTTSDPNSLDDAVLDRCDEMIHCCLPTESEKDAILTNEIKQRFFMEASEKEKHFPALSRWHTKQKSQIGIEESFDIQSAITAFSYSKMSMGFSGRDLCRVVRGLETKVYLSDQNEVNKDIWDTVVHDAHKSKTTKTGFRKQNVTAIS